MLCATSPPLPPPGLNFDSMRIGGSASDLPRETAMLRPTRPQMPLPGSDFLSKSAGSSPFIGIRRMDAHTLTPQISITAEDEFIEQGGCVGGVVENSSSCVLSVVCKVRTTCATVVV